MVRGMVRVRVRVSVSLCICAINFENIPALSPAFHTPSSSRYVKICQDMSRYVKICQDMSRYVKICQDMSRYVKICQDMSRHLHHQSECWSRVRCFPLLQTWRCKNLQRGPVSILHPIRVRVRVRCLSCVYPPSFSSQLACMLPSPKSYPFA